ncbi:MAG: DNA polymerase III [Treponema sp.]|nr:DNA polymerase III [Treponema sp.]
MFENILGQEAVFRLAEDIRRNILAPSMLFTGPRGTGKGTAALELGRVLSCENTDPVKAWKCSCPACRHHRFLYHPDLLALGSRSFSSEITAAAVAFAACPSESPARTFYIRAVRKLILRFSPVLWEDEPKAGKFAQVLIDLEGALDEIIAWHEEGAASRKDAAWVEKIGKSISKNVLNLVAEGITDFIPVAQIRRAAYWSRLAPQGKRKLLLIENADRMQDASRNALLKILEEPPGDVIIVLTTAHRDALLPTILSRLRPYRFCVRPPETEKEVLRRIFRFDTVREKAAGAAEILDVSGVELSINDYMDSFLPISGETLYPLAAFFAASAACLGASSLLRAGLSNLPPELEVLKQYASSIAEKSGLECSVVDTGSSVAAILKGAEDFKPSGLFIRFFEFLLGIVSSSLRCAPPSPGVAVFADIWREAASEAVLAVETYNQAPALVLDRLYTELTRRLTALYRPSVGL